MPVASEPGVSKGALWTGRILNWLVAALLLMDGGAKAARVPTVVEQTMKMGYVDGAVMPLGFVLCVSAILYAIPRTSVVGAILLTGYLGGAVASHVINQQWTNMWFPVILGVVIWSALVLRDRRLRAVMPWA